MDPDIRNKEKTLEYLSKLAEPPFVPTNTYRVQLNPKFTFSNIIEWIPYLKELGIDTLYTAPYFQANPGSMHGYDISSPLRLNPELGTEKDYEEFCKTLTKNQMGHIADLVANHMAATEHNEWWWDVLENGKFSIFNHYFDIDWNPIRPDLKNRVLIPVLQNTLKEALLDGSLMLSLTEGFFTLHLDHHFFPINPDSYPLLLGIDLEELNKLLRDDHRTKSQYLAVVSFFQTLPNPADDQEVDQYKRRMMVDQAKRAFVEILRKSNILTNYLQKRVHWLNTEIKDPKRMGLMETLLDKQHYRLTNWQEAPQSINYRRFFDINDLAALRVEDIEVFKHFHALLFRFIIENRIQGLRVDHPDGFYEPATYLEWLQRFYLENKLEKIFPENPPEGIDFYDCKSMIWKKEFEHKTPVYVVVEKILEERESLPSNWDIYGTVGYKYLNALNGLFVHTAMEESFTQIYAEFTSFNHDPEMLLYEQKKKYTLLYMLSEVNVLTKRLYESLREYEKTLAFQEEELKEGVVELFAAFPIYRTYVARLDSSLTTRDRVPITRAFEIAREIATHVKPEVFNLLEKIFFIDEHFPGASNSIAYRDFILRFQQLSPPIMAKGFEDTFLYIYNRFVSLNDVGGNPMRFGLSADEFHHLNEQRLKNWPKAFITTSTHDTKRSEDLRYRLDVLSEIPAQWKEHVFAWKRFNEKYKQKQMPDSNAEYLLYQSILGFWPIKKPSEEEKKDLIERMKQYIRKTAREAKVYTNWVDQDKNYENALMHFTEQILSEKESSLFWQDFLPFQKKVVKYGVLNSFSALTLKMGSPGVVDTYQGMEFLDFSLVDPDNRRPVDFSKRKSTLEDIKHEMKENEKHEMLRRWFSQCEYEKIKMHLSRQALLFRKKNPSLFLEGEYIPLEISGSKKEKIVGFIRKKGKIFVIFCVGRYFTDLFDEKMQEASWEDTLIHFPSEIANKKCFDLFTDLEISLEEKMPPAKIFNVLPQVVLYA